MNATKRKFNALVQGIGGRSSTPAHTGTDDVSAINTSAAQATPRRSTSSVLSTANSPSGASASNMSVNEDLVAKRRRLQALTEKNAAATNTIKSVGGTTRVSNVVLKKWTQASANGNFREVAQPASAAPAAKFAPNDRAELLKRLATFQDITSWTPKPDRVGEFEWAKRGWVCQGKERVRCTLCGKELLVKLDKSEPDGSKDASAALSADAEEGLKDKYAELIVAAHQEDCLWRRQGCDDSLLRLSLTNAKASYETLRQRYDELCERKHFLPYEFNLRLPEGLDIDAVLSQLPDGFFTDAPSSANAAETSEQNQQPQSPDRVAFALALLGWQGLSNARLGPVPNSASCHTCLRRLGLWMFKSKEVGPDNQVLVPAPMDHLDPAREHRFFCPWKNPQTQRWATSNKKPSNNSAAESEPAWRVLVQVIKNDAYLRGALDDRPKSSRLQKKGTRAGQGHGASTAGRPTTPGTPAGARGNVSLDAPSTVATEDLGSEEADDEKTRNAKDKERWARLRKVKSLFESKGARKLRQSLGSRPGTSHSNASRASKNTTKE